MKRAERGSAAVESIFAIVLLMFLVLAVVEVALVLYSRNVVMASAHEGARAAVELGRSFEEAQSVARQTVTRAAGGVVERLAVEVESPGRNVLVVHVEGRLKPFGPVPFPIVVTAQASAVREVDVP